jgi:hypothetical protein
MYISSLNGTEWWLWHGFSHNAFGSPNASDLRRVFSCSHETQVPNFISLQRCHNLLALPRGLCNSGRCGWVGWYVRLIISRTLSSALMRYQRTAPVKPPPFHDSTGCKCLRKQAILAQSDSILFRFITKAFIRYCFLPKFCRLNGFHKLMTLLREVLPYWRNIFELPSFCRKT